MPRSFPWAGFRLKQHRPKAADIQDFPLPPRPPENDSTQQHVFAPDRNSPRPSTANTPPLPLPSRQYSPSSPKTQIRRPQTSAILPPPPKAETRSFATYNTGSLPHPNSQEPHTHLLADSDLLLLQDYAVKVSLTRFYVECYVIGGLGTRLLEPSLESIQDARKAINSTHLSLLVSLYGYRWTFPDYETIIQHLDRLGRGIFHEWLQDVMVRHLDSNQSGLEADSLPFRTLTSCSNKYTHDSKLFSQYRLKQFRFHCFQKRHEMK